MIEWFQISIRRCALIFMAAVLSLGTSRFATAQTTATAQTAPTAMAVLHFTFRDSARGTVVRPDAVLIDNKMVFNVIDEAGRMSVPVTPGDHRVVIKADGYDDLDSRQTAALDLAPMNILMLDPAEQPEELKPENLGRNMPADGTVVVGYITDETMGKPVEGAQVELLGKNVKVETNENGYFKLPVKMPDGKQMPDDPRGIIFTTRDMRVTKPGYGFEERLNILVESGTPKIYQFQLIRGGGGNSIDESGSRNNLQSSLFGLRNVEPEDPATTWSMPSYQPRTTGTQAHTTEPHTHDHEGHSH